MNTGRMKNWLSWMWPQQTPAGSASSNVRERPLPVDLIIDRMYDPEKCRIVDVGIVRAPEAALRFNLDPVATGATAYFLVGLAGENADEVGATLYVTDFEGFPISIGPIKPNDPPDRPRFETAVAKVNANDTIRWFRLLRRFGYEPPRLFCDTQNRFMLLQQKIFGPTFHSLRENIRKAVEYAPNPDENTDIAGRGMFKEIVRAIDSVHKSGVIHGDVKADNLALLPPLEPRQGQVDEDAQYFGLIDVGNSIELSVRVANRPLRRGTVPYEAPEQLQKAGHFCMTEAVDVWAAGAVITEYCAFAIDHLNPFVAPLELMGEAERCFLGEKHLAYSTWYNADRESAIVNLEQAMKALICSRGSWAEETDGQRRLQDCLSSPNLTDWSPCPSETALYRSIVELAGVFPDHYRDMTAFSYISTRLQLNDPNLAAVLRACMNPSPGDRPKLPELLATFTTEYAPGRDNLPSLALQTGAKKAFAKYLSEEANTYTDEVNKRLEVLKRAEAYEDAQQLKSLKSAVAGARRRLIDQGPEEGGAQ